MEPSEVLKEIIVPLPPVTARGYYTRFQVRKAMDKAMTITDICLLKKTGGKSGTFVRDADS